MEIIPITTMWYQYHRDVWKHNLLRIVNGVIIINYTSFIVAKAQAVVYCTCSVYPEENEAVVKKALELQDLGIKVQPYR